MNIHDTSLYNILLYNVINSVNIVIITTCYELDHLAYRQQHATKVTCPSTNKEAFY